MDHPSAIVDIPRALQRALQTIDTDMATVADLFPDDTTVGNVYAPRPARDRHPVGSNHDWTPGFWTGMLWLAYELTGDATYRRVPERHLPSYVDRLERRIYLDTHDLGFVYSLSCVAAWRLTGNQVAKQAALTAADHLMVRYLDGVGIIQAWGDLHDPTQRGRTIIDSLLNMPLLYWASEMTDHPRYAQATYRHSQQLRDHIVRPDNTTFHPFYWNPATGAPLQGTTAQGYADDCCWTRGQAWGIYGFVLNYRATRDESFLHTALRCAEYFLAHLSHDQAPYWDLIFTDGRNDERDSSAAAIAVCGLQEIVRWLPAGAQRQRYQTASATMLASLAEHYAPHDQRESNTLLLHGVYGKPDRVGVNEGNQWGDYFYLEALMCATNPAWQLY